MKRITKHLSLRDIIIYGGILILLALGLFGSGCSTSKFTFPGGEFLHQPLWFKGNAKKVDFYYESYDPNGFSYTLWITINDPNRAVNPGTFSVTEPKTGINATVTAE